jgi:hypothetical protein
MLETKIYERTEQTATLVSVHQYCENIMRFMSTSI